MLEAKNQMGSLILIFITIIIGVTLISALGDTIYESVNAYSVTNESIDITAYLNAAVPHNMTDNSEIELAYNDIIAISRAESANETPRSFVEDTDWAWKDQDKGEIYLKDSALFNSLANSNGSNYTEWDYTYGTAYIQGSAISRTIMNNLVLIFVVFGLVIWVFAMVKIQWLDKIT